MLTIGFTGPPGAGKDTACEAVLQSASQAGLAAERFAFADALRALADRLLMLPAGHTFWDHPYKELRWDEFNNLTPRELLIDLGMLGRKYRPNIWCDQIFEHIKSRRDLDIAVITDVRFENEALALKAAGGVLIEVVRPGCGYDQHRVSESGQASPHASIKVLNDGDIEDLSMYVKTHLWNLISSPRVKSA